MKLVPRPTGPVVVAAAEAVEVMAEAVAAAVADVDAPAAAVVAAGVETSFIRLNLFSIWATVGALFVFKACFKNGPSFCQSERA